MVLKQVSSLALGDNKFPVETKRHPMFVFFSSLIIIIIIIIIIILLINNNN